MALEGIKSAAILLILLAFLCAHASGVENKTAYTRDGVHFVSKERMEENQGVSPNIGAMVREDAFRSVGLVVGS